MRMKRVWLCQIGVLVLKLSAGWTQHLTKFILPVSSKPEFFKITLHQIYSISPVMNSPIQVLYVLFLLSSRIPGTKEGGEGFLRLRNIQKPNRISKLDYSCPGEVGICMYFICLYPLYALWFFTSDFLALILTFKIFILLKFAFSINKFFWMKPFD